MNKTTIPIKGMHCRSCEIILGDEIRKLREVKSVKVNWKKKEAVIYSKTPVDQSLLRDLVQKTGYEVGIEDSKDWISRDQFVWKDVGIAFFVLTILYLIANEFGLFNLKLGSASGNPSSLAVVLVVGLTAGFSTCMALVGGLILGISAKFAEKHPKASTIQKFRPHLFFNLGRILSYFLLGGVIGLVGKAFQLSGGIMGTLLILVGIVMLIVGAQLTEVFPFLTNFSFSLPVGISKFFGLKSQHEKEYSHASSMITGALTFFLPCGFTQAMQLYAMSTGNFLSGALIMATFAIGTTPGLLGIGGLTASVKGTFARRFFKGAGILVIILAVINISNGLNLSGLTTKLDGLFQGNDTVGVVLGNDPNVKIIDGVQVVSMTQNANGYTPNNFTIKQNMPVKWVINSTDSNTCAASLVSQQIGVRKSLSSGQNIIEFTPTKTGKISFSCSMGMYRGAFNVVAN